MVCFTLKGGCAHKIYQIYNDLADVENYPPPPLTHTRVNLRVETQWMSHHLAQASLFGSENLFHRKSGTVNSVEASKHATFYLVSPHGP